jgi:hypothetical protein
MTPRNRRFTVDELRAALLGSAAVLRQEYDAEAPQVERIQAVEQIVLNAALFWARAEHEATLDHPIPYALTGKT